MTCKVGIWIGALAALQLVAQDPATLLGALQTRQDGAGSGLTAQPVPDLLPKAPVPNARPAPAEDLSLQQAQLERLDREIRAARAQDQGPRRFAEDLFETRQYGLNPTDGGIAEDYVLGVGDRLQMSVFGSATFEVPLQVDGRGGVVIPKVGVVPVAGLTLARARSVVQDRVIRIFSRAAVDLSVTRLREVRVFVLGEVYKPGSYLVPSLSSIINVISLAGGPTAVGSFRSIRVMRGGRPACSVDLYPMRAEGLGNLNFGFQNGDTLFVPLIQNQVQLEGGFTRVVATVPGNPRELEEPRETDQERRVNRLIRQLQARLGETPEKRPGGPARSGPEADKSGSGRIAAEGFRDKDGNTLDLALLEALPAAPRPGNTGAPLTQTERADLEDRLDILQEYLHSLKTRNRGDQRIEDESGARPHEFLGQPAWLSRWLLEGKAPSMQFEMLPSETVQDALRFAGGFALQAFSGSLTLRRVNPSGALTVEEVPSGEAMAKWTLQKGDVLTALPLRDWDEGAVEISGWARVQGLFARKQGQRVGDLLKNLNLALPDTYLERGELVRTLADGSRRFQSFNLTKAVAGDAGHDLLLENRDQIELYRIGDLRLPLTLTVMGPVTRPGKFEFIEGMRASDLLFRAGVPLKSSDQYVAELAHIREGRTADVVRLDLPRLVSGVESSPVDLKDDLVNPRLEPFDLLSVYAKPDFHLHRTITLSGQVVRPGVYELDTPKTSLRDIIRRAGGLTPEAMPSGGIFLRPLGGADPEKKRVNILTGIETADPTSNRINDILGRLSETKRMPLTGALMDAPLLHGLTEGALNRMVVNLPGLLAGDPSAEVELQDGDEVIIPLKTEVAFVVGETASPFASFKVNRGMKVRDILNLAGGPTRNADIAHIRLLKADGRIVDTWVKGQPVEPGDAVLVPQRIRRDVTWQENLAALTPLAVMINAVRK